VNMISQSRLVVLLLASIADANRHVERRMVIRQAVSTTTAPKLSAMPTLESITGCHTHEASLYVAHVHRHQKKKGS